MSAPLRIMALAEFPGRSRRRAGKAGLKILAFTHPLNRGVRIPHMIEQTQRRTDGPFREWSGTYGGFYLLPGEAWGVPVAADGTPQARCCTCSWECGAATEEEAARLVSAHLRAAHPDGLDGPTGANTEEQTLVPQVGLEPTTRRF